jgi:hypothetical protein
VPDLIRETLTTYFRTALTLAQRRRCAILAREAALSLRRECRVNSCKVPLYLILFPLQFFDESCDVHEYTP